MSTLPLGCWPRQGSDKGQVAAKVGGMLAKWEKLGKAMGKKMNGSPNAEKVYSEAAKMNS